MLHFHFPRITRREMYQSKLFLVKNPKIKKMTVKCKSQPSLGVGKKNNLPNSCRQNYSQAIRALQRAK